MAMQDVINKMKGTALGVAEYLTPILKVSLLKIVKKPGVDTIEMRSLLHYFVSFPVI